MYFDNHQIYSAQYANDGPRLCQSTASNRINEWYIKSLLKIQNGLYAHFTTVPILTVHIKHEQYCMCISTLKVYYTTRSIINKCIYNKTTQVIL